MLDDRVRAVLERLEREDAEERRQGLPPEQRSRAVAPTTGRFLFGLVAPQNGCEVLEIGKPIMAGILRDSPECLSALSALLARRKLEGEGIVRDATVPPERDSF